MQKFSAIFLAILLTLNVVCSLRLNPIDASMLPSNSLRTQLAQILTQVKQTENPKTIRNFLEQVQGMIKKLEEEQKKHQEISDSMMAQCVEEDKFREKEVADATDSVNRANEARGKCDNSLQAALKDLPELETALKTYEDELDRATKQRAAEHEAYLRRKADYEQAVEFLADFIKYVEDKLHVQNVSFVEKSEQLLRHATKLGLLKEAVPVLIALATHQEDEVPATHNAYTYKGRGDLADRLRTTLNDLLTRIKADLASNEETEQKAVEAFASLRAMLEAAINTLKENVDKTKTQIADMNKCISEEDAILATAGSKLARNTELKNSASKMCAQFALEFTQATRNRREEVATIREILSIIEKRFGKIPEDLKAYLENVEDGWVAYENSTAFKKFIDYEQKHAVDNAEGQHLTTDDHILQF